MQDILAILLKIKIGFIASKIDGGFDMVCSELDKDYFDAAVNRINKHVRQMDMFNERPEIIIHEPPKVLQAQS